jgi:glycosyltransferase involved in cell wall biosynthesis
MKIKENKPKVSVILPVYNAGRFLRECLDSILGQTLSDFELIAVDDGSDDASLYILKEYAAKDSRIKVYANEKNKGVSITTNRAIGYATADFIARMDADDVMSRTRLAKQYKFLQENKDHVLVGGQVQMVDFVGQELYVKSFPLEHAEIYKMLYLACPVQQATIMVNRALLPVDFVWYEDGMNTAEEVELLFKLVNYGKFANLNEIVHDYRQHDASLSHQNPKKTFQLTYIARKKGVKLHGYKPSIWQKLLMNLQRIIVALLPKRMVYPAFLLGRNSLLLVNNYVDKVFNSSLFRYLVAGGLTQVIDLATYAILLQMNVNYLVAAIINSPLVLAFNYLVHKYFTFEQKKFRVSEVSKYMLNIGLNYVYALVIMIVQVELLGINEFTAKVVLMGLVPILNYFMLKYFVYSNVFVRNVELNQAGL